MAKILQVESRNESEHARKKLDEYPQVKPKLFTFNFCWLVVSNKCNINWWSLNQPHQSERTKEKKNHTKWPVWRQIFKADKIFYRDAFSISMYSGLIRFADSFDDIFVLIHYSVFFYMAVCIVHAFCTTCFNAHIIEMHICICAWFSTAFFVSI